MQEDQLRRDFYNKKSMGKKQKIKVLEVLQAKDNKQDDFTGLIFKVQLKKSSQPLTMNYDQLKYCYPQILIDYYESRSDFFTQIEESQEFEEGESDLFDYDTHFYLNGSKILEYVNSLTYCLPVKQKGQKQPIQFKKVKVYQEQTQYFYKNFIQNQCLINSAEKIKTEDQKIQLE